MDNENREIQQEQFEILDPTSNVPAMKDTLRQILRTLACRPIRFMNTGEVILVEWGCTECVRNRERNAVISVSEMCNVPNSHRTPRFFGDDECWRTWKPFKMPSENPFEWLAGLLDAAESARAFRDHEKRRG